MQPTTSIRRWCGLTVGAAVVCVAALFSAPVAAQDGASPASPPPPTAPSASTTASTSTTTTTTQPPATVPVGDGDVGAVPPGADRPEALGPATGSDGSPGEVTGELRDPTAPPPDAAPELALPTLPDPGPGVNATLAAIEVADAEDTLALMREDLAAALPARVDALADLADAHERRNAAISARYTAEDEVRRRLEVINVYNADLLVHGQPAPLDIDIAETSPDDLGRLVIGESVSDQLQAQLAQAEAMLAEAIAGESAATAAIGPAESRLRVAEAEIARRRTVVAEAEAAVAAARERARTARRYPAPPILGPSVVSAEAIEAWYWRFYSSQPPVAPIRTIIDAYLRVGAEEGVAGDIAFAQAILETGGFRSGHARDANFAGIGAYDSCSPTCGFDFSGLEAGVRAHIHLLRAYADPNLTAADLAAPPHPLVAPSRVWVRGCCATWADLTGVWATDPNYDRKVLGIYRVMIEMERARRAGA